MLRRIISLAPVCAGLLLAAAPTLACPPNAPLKDCCPSGPGGPCQAPAGLAAQAAVVCCEGGLATPAAAASMPLPNDRDARPTTGNPPAANDSFVFDAAAGWRRSASTAGGEVLAYRRSGSLLYLSTGRLRL